MPNAVPVGNGLTNGLKERLQRRLGKAGLTLLANETLAGLLDRLRDAELELHARRDDVRRLEGDLARLWANRSVAQQAWGPWAGLAGLPLPVYVTAEGAGAVRPQLGASPYRIVVCSIPKAGTYLVAELLKQLGCVATNLHLSRHELSDYRSASVREMREEPERFTVPLDLAQALALVLPGQFAVGHLACDPDYLACLAGCKKLFVYRDLRDALVSFVRFTADTGRGGAPTEEWRSLPDGPDKMLRALEQIGTSFFNMVTPMVAWLRQPDVLAVAFETLYGDDGPEAQRVVVEAVQAFLNIPGAVGDSAALVSGLLGAPTKTWSGKRTVRTTFWSDAVEERFQAFGGPELNARLGYE